MTKRKSASVYAYLRQRSYYEPDDGTFVKNKDEVQELNSTDNFTCEESTITFLGQTEAVPNDGKSSSDYKSLLSIFGHIVR